MGYGGHLMWTAVARELKRKWPKKNIVFAKVNSFSWWDRLLGRLTKEPVESEIFYNNPNIVPPENINKTRNILWVAVNNPRCDYVEHSDSERVTFRRPGHVIEILCRYFGIQNPQKKCELYFTSEELRKAETAVSDLGKFVIVEPNGKTDFTPNKLWIWEYWQETVHALAPEIQVIQVGLKGKRVLDGVLDFTGRFTFRETAAIIQHCSALITTEGGLMHAANAVGARSVIIYTGYHPVFMTAYDENINLEPSTDHGPCGRKTPCAECEEGVRTIKPEMVVSAVKQILSDTEKAYK